MMSATLTREENCLRQIAEDTLQTLNCKTDDNLNEYIVLIVGIDEHPYLLEKLKTIISEDRVRSSNDIKTSPTFIDSLYGTNIFLIISGTLRKDYANEFIIKQHVVGVYVYCIDERKHALWSKGLEKIRCVVSNPTQLLIRLHGDIKQLSGRWPLGKKSFQKALTTTSQWPLYRCESIKESYKEMFNECRAYYQNNPSTIRKIDRFQQTYKPDNAIHEYTKDNFLYRIVNHALRTQDMETIKKFSPYIRDLHSQLHDYHQKYYRSSEQSIRAVYRGQYIDFDELDYLGSICKSRKPIITLTTFSSTSLDPDIALNFITPADNCLSCLFEIIITDEYNTQHQHMNEHEQAFANISLLSVIPDEQEVLFSLMTHFRVKHVEYPVKFFDHSFVLVILELITDKNGTCSLSHFDIISRLRKETNPQVYSDILHMLQVNAESELKFKNLSWGKWWEKLERQWGLGLRIDQPLSLIFYDCFTENLYWSRKAIEMHKDILSSTPEIESHQSSFSYLFKEYNVTRKIPTRWIALYEKYLKKFCEPNTKEVVNCLYFAGETYEMIADKECALECYEKALKIDVDDKWQLNNKILKKIKKLKETSKTIPTIKNEHIPAVKNIDKDFSGIYEVQQDQWSIYWKIKSNSTNKPSIKSCLLRLIEYLELREKWYDMSDSNIILRLPYQNTQDLSVNNYRVYFLSAVNRHISSSIELTDAANNRFLTLSRYERYMREWTLFKPLENFLQRFQKKLNSIFNRLLPRLERILKKLDVLITVCTVYLCVTPESGEINVNNLPLINLTNSKTRQLIFFDLHDSDLLADLEALEEESPTAETSFHSIPDDKTIVTRDLPDLLAECLQWD